MTTHRLVRRERVLTAEKILLQGRCGLNEKVVDAVLISGSGTVVDSLVLVDSTRLSHELLLLDLSAFKRLLNERRRLLLLVLHLKWGRFNKVIKIIGGCCGEGGCIEAVRLHRIGM